MSAFTWLKKWWSRTPRRARRGASAARLPRLEALEDRTLMATNLYVDFGDKLTGTNGMTLDGVAPVTHDNFISTINGNI